MAFRWRKSRRSPATIPGSWARSKPSSRAEDGSSKRTACRRTPKAFRRLKTMGFSDARLAKLTGQKEAAVRAARHALNIRPCYKRIDTCAAEFQALTPYMYSTYEMPVGGETVCEADPSDAKKIIILGGGPNRIGQGIEFDYCCCHAAFSLSEQGYETIMVNCNPETVSTDYDTSDRLYFEPLTPGRRAGDHRQGTGKGHPGRRDRAVRRPDPAQARQWPARCGRADPGHQRRCHRSGRRPQAFPEAAATSSASSSRATPRP